MMVDNSGSMPYETSIGSRETDRTVGQFWLDFYFYENIIICQCCGITNWIVDPEHQFACEKCGASL